MTHSANLSRRGFTKALIAAAACMPAAESLVTKAIAQEAAATPEGDVSAKGYQYPWEQAEGEWHFNACPRNCFDTCAIRSKVVDGTIVEIRGDKDNTYTKGGLCPKTQHYLDDWLYAEDRILYPMKRTGEKGPGCTFERISWDEAIQTITDKWKQIIAEEGPQAIVPYAFSGVMGLVNGAYHPAIKALFYRMHTPMWLPTMCSAAMHNSMPLAFGNGWVYSPEDVENTSLYVSWGINEAGSSPHCVKYIAELKRRGGKIVVVNPVHTPVANWADMFIQIKPGTDVPLALAVANILITEGLYDAEWVEKNSVGFDEFAAAAAEWSAADAAKVCGIEEQQIVDFAHLYGETKPSMMRIGVNPNRRTKGGMICLTASLLPALVGQLGAEHGGLCSDTSFVTWGVDFDAVSMVHLANVYDEGVDPESIPNVQYTTSDFGRILNGLSDGFADYSNVHAKSCFIFNANPIVVNPNVNLIREGLKRDDMFVIVHDVKVTDTVEYADIVLPAATHFESEDIHMCYGSYYTLYNEKVLENLGESVTNWELGQMLAKAMGYTDPEFDRTPAEIIQNVYGLGYAPYEGLSYDVMKEVKQYKLEIPDFFKDAVTNGFSTASGKYQFASDDLAGWVGSRVPFYSPDIESEEGSPEVFAKYPLALLTPNSKERLNSTFGDLPDNVICSGEPRVFICSADAEARGIEDGDLVRIFNDYGEVTRIAQVIDGLAQEGVVVVIKGDWLKSTGYENINTLIPDHEADFLGTTFQSCLVQIEKN